MEYSHYYRKEATELRISDCSSDEENVITRSNHNRSASRELATIEITWSSDDELVPKNCSSLLNRSYIDQSSTTPVSRKCFSSARKSKLPSLSVKHKLSKAIESIPVVRTTLGSRNIPSNIANNANCSPWLKVRKTFSTLRNQKSLPTIDSYAEKNDNAATKNQLSPQKSEITSIEWSSSSSESASPTRSTQGSAIATQKSTAPTELELLVALIERENAAPKMPTNQASKKQKKKAKRCVHGGYAERLLKLEEANRIERNFLHHDQQLGLQSGTRMRVLQQNQAYGVHMAKVQLEQTNNTLASDDDTTTVWIIIDADMAAHVKVGSRIEAFFDSNVSPYTIAQEGDVASKEVVYVQPHKLLLL